MPETEDWGSLYANCLALLPGELDRQEFILECVEEGRGRLNLAHLLMAQLMVNNFIGIVLTTNFDDLMLRALQLYLKVPAVLDPDSTQTLMIRSRFLQVAYLHGKLNSYRQRHTAYEVKQSIPGFEGFLGQAFQDHGLIVIGYRGGDEAPMEILMKVLSERKAGPGRGLYWVSHEPRYEKLPERVRELLKLKDTYWMPGWDADNFFEKTCNFSGIGLGLPDFLRDPAVFAGRVANILPEQASQPWSEFHKRELRDVTLRPKPLVAIEREAETSRAEAPVVSPKAKELVKQALTLEIPKRSEEAIALCREAIAADPQYAPAYIIWGDVLSALGRHEEGIEQYRRATEVDPRFAQGFKSWGDALSDLGRHEEAIEQYRRATEVDPRFAWAFDGWGDALSDLGRHEEAIEQYRRATEVDPRFAWGFNDWGNALSALGRHEEAIEQYRRATEVDPRFAQSFKSWGNALRALGRHEEAIEQYRRATEVDPRFAWAFDGWGNALSDLGRHEEAIEQYRRATEVDPRFAWGFNDWGNALSALGRHEEAIEQYRRATEVNPEMSSAYHGWGSALKALGRDEEAQEKLQVSAATRSSSR
jgi:tetratricopeptide (TPR) repeat protein